MKDLKAPGESFSLNSDPQTLLNLDPVRIQTRNTALFAITGSVADPDPGSGAFLTLDPTPYFLELSDKFLSKVL